MPMSWQLSTNTDFICQTIKSFAHLDILVFPELATTGFHRNLPKVTKEQSEGALDQIATSCSIHNIVAFVGHPSWQEDKIYNTYSCINEQGELAVSWAKIGLTDSEKTFFTAGVTRQIWPHSLGRFGSFICREANDAAWVVEQFKAQQADILFWPSYIGLTSTSPKAKSELSRFDQDAANIAHNLNTVVIQCNWPNALNLDNAIGMGTSKIFNRQGEVLHQLPKDLPCLGIFDSQLSSLEVALFQ